MSLFLTIIAAILVARDFDKIMSTFADILVKSVGYFFRHPVKALLGAVVGGYVAFLLICISY